MYTALGRVQSCTPHPSRTPAAQMVRVCLTRYLETHQLTNIVLSTVNEIDIWHSLLSRKAY